ncbi:DNA cytosine methyltransferase [Stenotrophomonas sp. AS1]|uniref:DNA cytosine methyltransferase n=1 Tax=Stenotrophomonas sp. AS1 TaxID=3029188 RepID=UPI003B7F35CE
MRYLSLFSGMEAAHLAWAPLGWECVAVAEIEPAACALLRHRLPDVPNLGSVTEITDEQIAVLGGIDVVIGGSPCQGLSVAGRRAGLDDARSGLFHEQMRIFNAARHLCGARFLVWENVPGAFSSNQGRDFAVVVGAMAGSVVPVPRDGWGCEGVALGDNGLVEWSVLDAQWFGVAQRRRRVFSVLDTGNWSDRPPVLLEPESMRRHPPARPRPYPTIDCGIWRKRQCNQWVRNGFAIARPGGVSNPTPLEVERLFGAPDNWTLVPDQNGALLNDGPRYRMLGNSFAVPVIRWIGTRIDAAAQAALRKVA